MPLVREETPSLAKLAEDFAWGRRFIVWIGSGLSIPSGIASWSQLRTRLERRLAAASGRKLTDLDPAAASELIAHIRRLPNPWEAFEILRERLGSDYNQVISIALNDSGIPQPPASLKRIWSSSNVDGIISLNIDNLASRAFYDVYRGRRELSRALGTTLSLGSRFLSSSQSFFVQLHGRIEDESSWIFTRPDLDRLFSRPDYRSFVRSALTARRILFIGCSPDDTAVAKHFSELAEISHNMPEHYWLVPSHEIDAARDDVLGKMGINIVEYSVDRSLNQFAQNDMHLDAIQELFDYIENYQYVEPEPDPVNPMAGPSGVRLPPERVQAMAPEQARNILSRYATSILEGPERQRMGDYQAFIQAYGPAIAVASYVPRNEGAHVFGHQIVGDLGEGAFSRVLEAIAPDGLTRRAIKLVRNEVRDDPVMLRSFRRGVRSMQILSDKGIDGMVSYEQAYEIPPCVIMPFVDGHNLENLAGRHSFSGLKEGLPILAKVAEIVYSAHNLPERVLHRDLRPSNIMVRSQPQGGELENRVVVLDFDLSWHEGADTDSPISPNMTTVLGYLAPEQIASDLSISARHAKVDTFGLCMTLYYIMQKQHPDFRVRASKEWSALRDQIGRQLSNQITWKSLLCRIRRLIHFGTEVDQAERLEFDFAVSEIALLTKLTSYDLGKINSSSIDILPLETVAEEIFATALDIENYEWSSRAGKGRYIGTLGIHIDVEVSSDIAGRGMRVEARKQFDGMQSFSTVRKYWGERQREINAIMSKAGWQGGAAPAQSRQEVSLTFFAPEELMWTAPTRLAKALEHAWTRLDMV